LLIELDDHADAETRRRTGAFLDALSWGAFVSDREPLAVSRGVPLIEVTRPRGAEQRQLWKRALADVAPAVNGSLDELVGHFDLSLEAIAAAAAQLAGDPTDAGDRLWEACRNQARRGLDELAERIEPRACWDDLVIAGEPLETLREIVTHVRGRMRVYEQWGFARRSARGLGISAIFEGASGTGKTMAAEVLARELRLDLYRIDLSEIVSKYIGETEKNLRRVFDAAEAGGAILLFDEADALFGKRTEVKDSHDRYANIEVSYLLTRMEAYRGLAILTTNAKEAIDRAFMRRIRFVVRFAFPSAAERAEIWSRAFPPEAPAEGLDPVALAQVSLTGGNIRNVALGAAFLAVDEGDAIGMRHVARAAVRERAKLERPLPESEVAAWR
jgi:SpoVK/Ycf46/Vps4 family AAA+-type ATPase